MAQLAGSELVNEVIPFVSGGDVPVYLLCKQAASDRLQRDRPVGSDLRCSGSCRSGSRSLTGSI